MSDQEFQDALRKGAYVELSLACADVPRLDVASKSDPFCVIFCKDGEAWRRTGMTETVYDTHACQWVQKIPAQATDGTVYRFDVYDRDSPQDKLTDHDFIGSCADVRLVDILQAEGKVLNLALHRTLEKKSYGTLQVSADAVIVRAPNPPVCLQVALDSKVRAKFFFTLTRQMPHGGYHPVYRSELLEKSDCHFSPLTLKVSTLCAGQPTRNLRLELYQFFPMGRSKAVGFSPFSLGGLQRKSASDTLSWTKAKNGDACNVLLDRSEDPATASTTCKVTITRCCP